MTQIKTAGLFQFHQPTLLKEYSPISLEYFLDMELAMGGGGKEIIKQNTTLHTVRDVIDFFKTNTDKIKDTLLPSNWQYFNCMVAEFRHNVGGHHELGWENMTKEYYESLDLMSDKEIEQFLKEEPVDFHNGFIKHGYHRACSMIGRLIKGKSYIPFYMKTSQIYKDPTKHDNIHRIKPITNKTNLLKQLDEMGIDKDDYCLTQSSILSVMGIRSNDDLDLIISSELRNQNIQFPQGIDVFPANISKFNYFGAKGDDDILENYCIEIDGYKFLEPRFYFARKNRNETPKDINDWKLIKDFFEKENHKGYPFNFDFYKWGINYVNKVQLETLDLLNMKPIISKYERILEGVNHGRAVYYDSNNKQYIKIFHPKYCRLDNFKNALHSGFLNGLCPALTDLIYDKDNLVGYICKEGTILQEIPRHFLITLLRNCEKQNKIYYDFVPQNVIKLPNGQYSLIDLESVYNIDENLQNNLKKDSAEMKPNNLLELIPQLPN